MTNITLGIADDYNLEQTIQSLSERFIGENIYEMFNNYNNYYTNHKDWLLLSLIILLRGPLKFFEIIDFETIFNIDFKYDKSIINKHAKLTIDYIMEVFPRSYSYFRKLLSFKYRCYLWLSRIYYGNRCNELLKFVILLSTNKKFAQIFKEELKTSVYYQQIINEVLPYYKKHFINNITERYIKYIIPGILDDMNCFSYHDVKSIRIYSYIDNNVYQYSHTNSFKRLFGNIDPNIFANIFENDTVNNDLLYKLLTSEFIIVLLHIIFTEFKCNAISLDDELEYTNIKKFSTCFPKKSIMNHLINIKFIVIEYNTLPTELYIPFFSDNRVLVYSEGDTIKFSAQDLVIFVKSINNVKPQSFKDTIGALDDINLIFTGNIDNFLVEFNYYYNSYIRSNLDDNFSIDNIKEIATIDKYKRIKVRGEIFA